MKYRIYGLLVSALMSFTSMAQEFSARKGGNCFTMDIPDYFTRTFELNDNASLQYRNTSRVAFLIVIEDDKSQLESMGIKFVSARDFVESFSNDFKKDFPGRKQGNPKEFSHNGNKHAQVEFYWTEEGSDFYMLITGVETPEHFYKIMCWTPLENKPKINDDFLRISKSLRE